jgi:hypothetical protein
LLVSRYGFLKYPVTFSEYGNLEDGIAYLTGSWKGIEIEEFRIFTNGFSVATGESTDHAEALFDDLMAAWNEAGFVFRPDMVYEKRYVSQVIVRSEFAILDRINPAINKVVDEYLVPRQKPSGATALWFYVEGNVDFVPIRIEREAGRPLALNQYFSQAPFPTDRHLSFLDAFEKALTT